MTVVASSITSPRPGRTRCGRLLPAVSVVIPTHGRSPWLFQVLDALDAQVGIEGSSVEVVVVLDGAGSQLASGLRRRARAGGIRVVEILHAGTAAARDAGWRAARAPLIVFLDDEVVPSARLVVEHLAALGSCERCVVLGRVEPPAGRLEPWTAYDNRVMARKYAGLGRDEVPSGIHYGGNVSLRRDLVRDIGGHDHVLQHDADVELGDRLRAQGVAFVYRPAAVGIRHGGADYRTWRRGHFLHGRWDVALRRDRGLSGGLEGLLACFYDRHPLNRVVLRIGLGRRTADEGGLADAIAQVGSFAYRLHLDAVSYAAFSCAANLLYWSGVRDGMRGSAAFWKAVRAVRRHRGRPYLAMTKR